MRAQFWHLRKGGIRQWKRHRARVRAQGGQARPPALQPPAQAAVRGRPVPDWPFPDRPPRRDLRVGVILDQFSATALRWEWQQVELTPSGWREQVAAPPIELLFVESAWAGSDGAWRYALTGSRAPTEELRELVQWCRDHGIPTVFWNKEDPAHFEDFIDTAAIFDRVLTTDAEMVPRYVDRLGHDRVSVMPFAAASWIHNPMRPEGRPQRDVAFAGMYFAHKFPERRAQMDLLIGAAAAVSHRMPTGLEIFSRFQGGDERYQFPKEWQRYEVGSLTYPQMLSAYRQFKVFLNVSSVPDSRTMCPRRIFEISACATPVVSTPTPAITSLFPSEEMVTVDDPQTAAWTLRALVGNDEWRDRLGHLAARRVLSEHTYRHRIDEVLGLVGLGAHQTADPSVSAIVSTNRPGQLDHVLTTLGSQRDVDLQVVLLTHGFEAPADLQQRARDLGIERLVLLTAPAEQSLGECLNQCVEAADGDVIAKFDDDDWYGPHYLADQLRALDYSGADVVGKHAHHVHLLDLDALAVRYPEFEHRFTHFVMGPTFVMPRKVAAEVRFADQTRGEDTDFLRRLVADGGKIYASDRFGFVQVRGHEHGHTWDASDVELLASGKVVAFGANIDHALI